MKVDVGQGCLRIARAPTVLVTANLGSCIALMLYDRQVQMGALLHIKLASRFNTDPAELPESLESCTMYASTGIPLAIDLMEKYGASRQRMTAKIVGGARMFVPEDPEFDIGANNIVATKELLGRYAIGLCGEETGGTIPRTVEFDLATGRVTVFSGRNTPLVL